MTRHKSEATVAVNPTGRGLRLVRLALATTERLWPALAVRAACNLFCTPLPTKWQHPRKAWDAQWRIDAWPFEGGSVTLYTDTTAPQEGPVALLVHGWGGHAGQMLALAQTLGQQGLRPMILELPAHGRSTGLRTHLPQFARAIEYVTQRLRQQGHAVRVLVAHSLGATACAFATSRGLPVERLVLLAPVASPPAYTRFFAKFFGISEDTRAAMQRRIEAREGLLLPQFEPASSGPGIRVPTLVVHDKGDNVNRFADGQAYAHAVRGAQLLATEALGHRKILKDAHVLGQVAIFSSV